MRGWWTACTDRLPGRAAGLLLTAAFALPSCGGSDPQPSALPSLGGPGAAGSEMPSFAARAPADTRLLARIDATVVDRIADSPWLAQQLAGYSLCDFKLRDHLEHLDLAIAGPAELRLEVPGPMTVADVACLLGQPHREGALRVGAFVVTPRPGGGVRITTPRAVEDGPGAPAEIAKRFAELSATSPTVAVGALEGDAPMRLELTQDEGYTLRFDMGDEARAERAHTVLSDVLPSVQGKAPALAEMSVSRDGSAIALYVPGHDVMQITAALGAHLMETYATESPSMLPTLWTGDHLLLLKGTELEVGDVVAFRAPDGGDPLLGRIVATGGVRVKVSSEKLTVDGKDVEWKQAQEVYRRPDVPFGTAHAPVELWTERLGDREHEILLSPAGFGAPRGADERVRDGRLFVLGDYRDNARDSRHFGAIQKTAVLGEVVGVWASFDPMGKVRWERIGLSP